MKRFEQDDAVVTPTGRRARLLDAPDAEGFCTVRYFQAGPDGRPQDVCLHERLLRLIYPGREAPPPVRIDALGRRR